MNLTLQQFIENSNIQSLKIEAGNKWLKQKALRGIQTIEEPDSWKMVENGELLVVSGVGFSEMEKELLEMLDRLQIKEASLLIRKGKYIENIPETVLKLSEEKEIVIMSIPYEVRLQPIIRKTYEMLFHVENKNITLKNMLQNIMSGTYGKNDLENAYHMGFEVNQYYVAAVIVIDGYSGMKDTIGKEAFQKKLTNVYNRVEMFLHIKQKKKFFCLEENNNITVLINNEGPYLDKRYMLKLFNSFQKSLAEKETDISVSVGFGTPFGHLSECRRSLAEAKRTMQILQICDRNNTIRSYDDIGIYRLLFEMQDQEEFVHIRNGIIGKLLAYDAENNENLMETLEVYLENDRNIKTAAVQLFLHRNTMKYRLTKIENILMCDLSDVNTCFNLRLAYKINKFLESERINPI